MRNYKELNIWHLGMSIVKTTYEYTSKLPSEEKYGLKSQMNRCAVSIPSNIAERCSRTSNKVMIRFLEIAIGSSFELETQCTLCIELGFINKTNSFIESLNTIQKKMNAFRSKLIQFENEKPKAKSQKPKAYGK